MVSKPLGRAIVVIAAVLIGGQVTAQDTGGRPLAPTVPGEGSTADHSKFEVLKGPFASGPEVTKACLSCHTEADDQVMHSIHWSWSYDNATTGQTLGKKNVVNAFCGNVASNEARCTSCHTGYGWEDVRGANTMSGERVDCLACHDRSGNYTKLDNAAGHPPLEPLKAGAKTITGASAWVVDLAMAAQSVGKPGRDNCGSCHFYGGGGDNVKHGDLSSALISPAPSVDVHMSPETGNFTCESCHLSDKHVFAGSRYNLNAHDLGGTGRPGERRDVATCESCHSAEPHGASLIGMKLNDHVERVACQTCHIPTFAKGGVATKTMWDWSTAGELKDGKPFHEENFTQSDGKQLHTYLSTKGDFEWGEDVVPHYAWFDGQVEYTLPDDRIDPTGVVEVNRLSGSADDPGSRIWPFKRMEGRQAYDTQLNTFVYTQVYGPQTASAFWTNFDWEKSIKAAMDYVGQPYSGEFDFVDTYMYWPITHMVAPADEALQCDSCHARNARLAGITGVYIPGSTLPVAGKLGLVMLALAALAVMGHGVLRLMGRGKGGSHHG
ncbi:tetrathionate reductase family octaheme c-type cytochrome [Aliigemmobacter aestuarii]|nr:tetrathionate reductase family octaheme c-type cytochrome [Gemmobacter aestuarii]